VTLAIAIVGAVTGLLSLVLMMRREWLDRPRLHIGADVMTRPDGSGELVFTVENRGRQPVTVGAIGLEWDVMGEMPAGSASGRYVVKNPWERTLIPPGGSTQVTWPVAGPSDLPVDTPLRPFVEAGPRTIYGRLGVLFRILHEMAWRPVVPISEEQLRPRVLTAKPVVPRWKLWRPGELRTPQTVSLPSGLTRGGVEEFRARLGIPPPPDL
jgi:hypothetical protein